MNVNSYDTRTLHDRVNMPNRDQTRVYLTVKNHLLHQQKTSLLDGVRCGFPTEQTIRTLQQRIIEGSITDKFVELQHSGLSPVCLFPTKKVCDNFNTEMLNHLTSPIRDILCADEVDEL